MIVNLCEICNTRMGKHRRKKTGVGTRKMNKMDVKKGTQNQKDVNKIKRRKHFCSCRKSR